MRLCWIRIHKFTQWRAPRHNIQTRKCIYCGLYERREVHTIILPLADSWKVTELVTSHNKLVDGILEETDG